MEIVLIIATVLILLAFISMFVVLAGHQSTKKPMAPKVGSIGKDFFPTQMFMENGIEHGIAIHEPTHQFCLIRSDQHLPQIHPCSDLLASKLVKNGTPLEQTIRTAPTQVEAKIQELRNQWDQCCQSTTQASNQTPANQRLDVCLFTRDQVNPFHIVNFLDMEAKPGGLIYHKAFATARYWQGLMREFIELADTQAKSMPEMHQAHEEPKERPPDVPPSPVEELTKLATLLEKRFITQEEFDAQKQKILTTPLEPVRD